MRKLCSFFLILLLCSIVPVKGQLLHEGFESNYPFAGTFDTLTNEGITYANAGTFNEAPGYNRAVPFIGNGCLMMYCKANALEQVSFVRLPEKSSGGVGLIHFYYRREQDANPLNLTVQTSTDGLSWTTVDVIEVSENAKWTLYSKIINDNNAKHVRLIGFIPIGSGFFAPSYCTYIDELYISDDGVDENFTFDVSITSDIKTTVGAPINFDITLTGEGIPAAGVTLTLSGPYSTSENMPIIPTDGSLDSAISITFNPVEYENIQNMAVTIGDLGVFYYALNGKGLQSHIFEGFNDINDLDLTTKKYHGWQIGSGYNGNLSSSKPFEGTHSALIYSGSITSPEKSGGVGEISFWYRSYSDYANILFTVSVSSDGENWTPLEDITSTPEYQQYFASVDSADCKFVRVSTTSYNDILIDVFEISAYGQKIPGVSAPKEFVSSYTSTPYQFDIPLNFIDVTGRVYLAVDNSQLTPALDSLDNPNGAKTHQIIYTPVDSKDFLSANLTVSGGNISIAKNIPIILYEELSSVSENFDSSWGYEDYNTGKYLTYYGWKIENGARYANAGIRGDDDGSANLSHNGAIYSRPLKEGIGDIVYYAKPGYDNVAVKTYVSADRETWTEKDSTYLIAGAAYGKRVVVVNDGSAKWVKIVAEAYSGATNIVNIDNVSVCKYGDAVADIKNVGDNTVAVAASTATPATFTFKGHGFSSNPTIALKQGTAFSINGKTDTVVNTADINDVNFVLPVTVNTASATADTIVIWGGGLDTTAFIVKAIVVLNNAFIDFDNAWEGSDGYCANSNTADGWAIVSGNRNTELSATGFGSAGCLSLCGNSSLTTPPLGNGVGDIQVFMAQYSDGSARIDTSADGIVWEAFLTFPVLGGNNYNMYSVTVGSPTVKYVRLVSEWTRVENVTVKEYGAEIPYITFDVAPKFEVVAGGTQVLNIAVTGHAISEDITLSLSTGEKFSFTESNVITANDINGKMYNISVSFSVAEGEGSYFEDIVSAVSDEIGSYNSVNISGVALQQYISQDFENMVYNNNDWHYYGQGWEAYNRNSTGGVSNSNWATLNVNEKVISVGKAGGVGEISFVYAQSASYAVGSSKVIINTYEALDGDATQVDSFSFSDKTLTEKVIAVNSPTAKYVEFKVLSGASVGFDNIMVTPFGKGISVVSLQDKEGNDWVEPIVYAYSGVEKEVEFKILVNNFEGETVALELLNPENAEIGLSKTTHAATSNKDTVDITLTYTGGISADVVLHVSGVNYTKDFSLAHFVTYADTIVENFDGIENVLTTNSSYSVEPTPFGIRRGFVAEWCKALPIQMMSESYGVAIVSPKGTSGEKHVGVLTSPEKLHGVSEIQFVYNGGNTYGGGIIIQVSENGSVWTDLDTIITTGNSVEKYSLTVDYPNAKYVRWQGYGGGAGYDDYDPRVIIDSVVIAGFAVEPYLALVNTVEPVDANSAEPVDIEISVEGELLADASVSLNEDNGFSCVRETITATELLGGQIVTFNVSFVAAENGNYKDTLRIYSEGVETLVIPLEVTRTVVANDIVRNGNNFSCYFTENTLNIKGVTKGEYIRVSDVLGKVLYTGKAKGGDEVIYTNSPRGIYMVTVGNKTVKLLK
jgi:hypothetical protein